MKMAHDTILDSRLVGGLPWSTGFRNQDVTVGQDECLHRMGLSAFARRIVCR
jgi:hypothetical protein